MPYGWTGRCLLVDLSTGKLTTLDTTEYSEGYLGGRGMAARFAWEQMPDCTGPFDPENRIIIATGPFTGTLAPTSGRTVMSGLSPRTYSFPWYTHSTLGGWFGAELKYAGYDSLIIFGRADKPVYLYMTDEGTQMINADNLWGLGCRETQLRLRERYGSWSQILTIGPAGENLVRFATVAHAEENAAAHSGFGAVWGNKNLKAVVVRGSGGVCVAHPKHLIREILAGGSTYRIAATTNIGRPSSKNENKAANPVCSQACTFDCKLGHYATNRHGRRVPAFCIGGCWTHHWDLDGTEYSGGGITIPKGVSFETFQDVDLHETCNDLGLDL